MSRDSDATYLLPPLDGAEFDEPIEYVTFDFAVTRREFTQLLGAGLLITVLASPSPAQRRGGGGGRGGRGPARGPIAARVHIGQDGALTVFTGKVEGGQGSRAELTQAAAEELRVAPDRIRLVMADTSLVPDDGTTAGSRTTPSTVPAVRAGCAAARGLMEKAAAKKWKVPQAAVRAREGEIEHPASGRKIAYAQLAADAALADEFAQTVPADVELEPLQDWNVMGSSVPRPNLRDIVTGKHAYPSDTTRPGMLYGKILRPPAYGATLTSIDLAKAKALSGVVVVRDNQFVGVAAPTTAAAEEAIDVLAGSAKWERREQVSSRDLFGHLRARVSGGMPGNPFADELKAAHRKIEATYEVAYVQHAPMEPRAAVAEWADGGLTVWTATQAPFGVRSELARAFRLDESKVRVIVPDFGGGFGGRHSGESAVEAARLAREAGKPVCLRWTRAEEFTWAYFRPAALIDVQAGVDAKGAITSWHFVNVNSGGSAVETPYRIASAKSQYVQSEAPLRQGSYRALASTANNFARESAMDELAHAAGIDPLAFRLAHLEEGRLRSVLEEAARRFDWSRRVAQKRPGVGVGIACGTEKGSYVATCAEIEIEGGGKRYRVTRVCQAFECGAIINPRNLEAQNVGCIVMGLGAALREAVEFEKGGIQNASFSSYEVPRFSDVPEIEIHLLNRPDLPSVGGGETPIIGIAPAIANAVFHATGRRIRRMPIRLDNPAA